MKRSFLPFPGLVLLSLALAAPLAAGRLRAAPIPLMEPAGMDLLVANGAARASDSSTRPGNGRNERFITAAVVPGVGGLGSKVGDPS
ncbi:hypothetical protein KQ305_14635, partial [Synechococcus sp. CS-1332]|nr:hypothetical protein [Synechococcus sp. CS-1332]